MTVRFDLRIDTEDGISATRFVESLTRLGQLVRSATIVAISQIGAENELPQVIIQAATWRALTNPDGLLWIESIERGSIDLKAILLAAVISMSINSTIGESVKDGWKQTKTHHYISQSIPRIEEYFVHAFEKLLSSKDRPIEPTTFELVKFAINHDHIDWSIAIEIRSARSRLG